MKRSKRNSKSSNKKIGYKIQPTVIPVSKPFPPSWQIRFFKDLDDRGKLECSLQLYTRTKDKENCSLFDDSGIIEIYNRLISSKSDEYFMIVYDTEILNEKEIGLIGFIWYDCNFNEKDIYIDKNNHKYFMILTVWSCTFTTNQEFREHYTEKKKDYDISVAKYLKINLLQIMTDNLTKRDNKYYLQDHSIDYVMTYGCSLVTAIDRHEKNGARRMTEEELNEFEHINIKNKPKKRKNLLQFVCIDDQIPMYWALKL